MGSWLAVVLLAISSGAAAQPPAQPPRQEAQAIDDEEARGLFRAGAAAFEAGRYEDALSDFQRAYDRSPRGALLYNVGTAADRLRRDRDALAAFEQYLREVPDAANRAAVESRVAVLREAIARADAERAATAEARAAAERERNAHAEAPPGGAPPSEGPGAAPWILA